MMIKKLPMVLMIILIVALVSLMAGYKKTELPLIAIAYYGPHASLEASLQGVKQALAINGFIENKTIRYEIADVGFDPALIPQTVMHLKSHHPKVMVVMTTPIAQFAKGAIKDIPLIYNVITDPIAAGLLKEPMQPDSNMSGSADQQNLDLLLQFAQRLLPTATRVGLLYATAESNDLALVTMMRSAAKKAGMTLLAVPVDQAREIPIALQNFKDKVDFIYVGSSGPIQPTLPVIAAESNKMAIPILNVDEDAVKTGLVLASFGVDHQQVGSNAGQLVVQLLNGVPIQQLTPLYPTDKDHHGFISKKKAQALGITLPAALDNVTIVE